MNLKLNNIYLKTTIMKIKLGTIVRDKVTGFEGTATAKVEYLNGCVQYCITPRMKEDGKMPDSEYLDENQIEIVKEGKPIKTSNTGGPQFNCPKH